MKSKFVPLAVKYPELAADWHPTKNNRLTPYDVGPGSNKKVWWKCSVQPDHEWETRLSKRTGPTQTGCPFCSSRKVCLSNSLATALPSLCLEWHPKNGSWPTDVRPGSRKKMWWLCLLDSSHEWEAEVWSRSRGYKRCPFCYPPIVKDGRTKHMTKSEYNESYYELHAEEIRAYSRQYRADHLEDVREKEKQYYREHKENLLLKNAKQRARRAGLPFDITLEDVRDCIPLDRVCPITGTPFEDGDGKVSPSSMTLDRIIPDLGYVKGNIAVISHLANTIKQNCTDPEIFQRMADYIRSSYASH